MADQVKLKVQDREDFSGSRLNELRNSGNIPAVLYGPDVESTSIYVDSKKLKQAISGEHGENALINLKVGKGKAQTVIIKEIQVDPVSMAIKHVDFCQIRMTEKVHVDIPVEVAGEAPGVKAEGGVLDHVIREVPVSCLPSEIPDNFVLDVSGLSIGDVLNISDIECSPDVEILAEPDALVVHIVPPDEYSEPEEEELEEEVEPEVIGEKKEEEAEEEAEPSGQKEEKTE
ncbi:MAG: 50S ribosomal protein L25/general stress protein Ctc [Elusimicrobiota bacterium]